ncbi:ATP cone domain-containing protein [Clostridium ihumii]|uniref:ATP cone domain-containing protein n=1 Tax=Clostridium ihumii TaxID=1470356 RepID=UPI003D343B02
MKLIKKDGRLEEFNEDKIKISIENASDDSEGMLTESDVDIIINDVMSILNNLRHDDVTSSYEVKGVVISVLSKDRFKKIAEEYAKN